MRHTVLVHLLRVRESLQPPLLRLERAVVDRHLVHGYRLRDGVDGIIYQSRPWRKEVREGGVSFEVGRESECCERG